MAIRDWTTYQRALRAAAGVTGVLKRRGVALATAAALTGLPACASQQGAPADSAEPTPSEASAPAEQGDADTQAQIDALGDCTTEDGQMMGHNSDCCTTYRELTGEQFGGPIGCTPWGPPAPPAYSGGTLA